MITHVVLLKLIDPEDRGEAKTRLEALPERIVEIQSLAVGLNIVGSPSSYDVCLTTTHDSVEALQSYQDHPVHQDFLAWVRPRLSARAVVDSES